jgi:vacuolar-type H+-ATPase subunit I/STV1
MLKGVTLGILVQCISVAGYLMIANVASIKSEVFRTGLMVVFAGVVALIAIGYTVVSGQQRLAAI